MLIHGYLCHDLMVTFIVPVLKYKKGDINKVNYRPIVITSLISKILKALILKRYQYCLLTSDSQLDLKEVMVLICELIHFKAQSH